MKKTTFIWPQEPFLPTSLFKHYVYLGEVAGYTRKFADVKTIDLSVEKKTKKELTDICSESDYVFIPTEPYTTRNSVRLADLVKQSGDARSIVYGTAPSLNPSFFCDYFDIVLKTGHWEGAIKRLLTEEDYFNKLLKRRIYSLGEPLDSKEWSHPPLDLLPVRDYLKISGINQLEIGVQKGCKFNCSFCVEKSLIRESRVYSRDPENLVKFLKQNEGYEFYLDATTFSQDKNWAMEVCNRITSLGYPVRWKTVTRVDKLNEEIIKKMSMAGCYKIGFGIETFSENLQCEINKPIGFDKVSEVSATLKNYNIQPRAFLILGIPGQTFQDIYSTQEKIKELDIEYRWKEYVPFGKIPEIKNLSEFDEFERNSYRFYDIPGLSKKEYTELLEVKR